jgi:hypothetical protein
LNNTLHLEVSEQEIEEAFAPGIARIVSDRDPEWTAKEKQLNTKLTAGVPWWRRLLRPAAEKRVRDAYEKNGRRKRRSPALRAGRIIMAPSSGEPGVTSRTVSGSNECI